MNREMPEEQLWTLFRKMRDRDERTVPGFGVVLDRGLSRRNAPGRIPALLGFAGAVVCAVASFVLVVTHMQPSANEELSRALKVSEAIYNWTAPSDVFLDPPHPGLLRESPEIGEVTVGVSRSQ